jgi:hypothetical protein
VGSSVGSEVGCGEVVAEVVSGLTVAVGCGETWVIVGSGPACSLPRSPGLTMAIAIPAARAAMIRMASGSAPRFKRAGPSPVEFAAFYIGQTGRLLGLTARLG